uniref:NADH-ubiquinone oxidoreductase chain 6 n=1 Tax=Trichiosoma anthracinum TaxID=1809733 RepID=A0A140GZ98_9HYME|nr:NADH dehydrogenase subunit 6 [Trichiosoma anthracinum]AMN87270.1 NADH dehydrogenase subunit 6 [Trichiosoma anthracinum]
MSKILMLMMFLNSINFLTCKTPLSMGLILLIQTLMISLNSNLNILNSWFSYILFLIMLGGMMILFIYITSLTSNLKFKFNKKLIFINIISFLMLMHFIFNNNGMMWHLDFLNMNTTDLEMNFTIKYYLKKMFFYPNYKILLMMINYLLLTLFIVVKIININKGPLRKT